MSDSPSWLNDFHECHATIRRASDSLFNLADALGVVGNEALSAKLELLASDLVHAEKIGRDALNANVIEGFESSQRATANMMAGILAVSAKKSAFARCSSQVEQP